MGRNEQRPSRCRTAFPLPQSMWLALSELRCFGSLRWLDSCLTPCKNLRGSFVCTTYSTNQNFSKRVSYLGRVLIEQPMLAKSFVELIHWRCLNPVLLALNVSLCGLIFRPPQYIPLTCACVMLTWHLPIWMKALGSEPGTTCLDARPQELVTHFDSKQVKW
jgi:hypothetical protein